MVNMHQESTIKIIFTITCIKQTPLDVGMFLFKYMGSEITIKLENHSLYVCKSRIHKTFISPNHINFNAIAYILDTK